MYVRLNFYSCPVNSTRLQKALHVCEDIVPINIVRKVWKVHTRREPKTYLIRSQFGARRMIVIVQITTGQQFLITTTLFTSYTVTYLVAVLPVSGQAQARIYGSQFTKNSKLPLPHSFDQAAKLSEQKSSIAMPEVIL